ncbi:MAG: heat-inducible transcriptional repressor HrcA [Gudongella sp.]|nr:heat-inducible transcriptional repressor HrcA [Gudongella sp.]
MDLRGDYMLDERKLKVLYAIIESYITSAEPIGSRTISKDYNLGVGSATIRNEMSDLEEMGYLIKTHSSSGRIPSDKGYRLYVDNLSELKDDKNDFKKKYDIKKILEEESKEIEQLILNSSRLLSQITSYTSLALSPKQKESKIRHIQLLPIDKNQILLIIVNESGVIKNTIFHMEDSIPDEQLNRITNMLNIKLKNRSFYEIDKKLNEELFRDFNQFKGMIEEIIPIIGKSIGSMDTIELYSDGLTRLLNFPEYRDIDRVKSIISFIEDKNQLMDLLLMDNKDKDIDITIGTENIYVPVRECSIITATYKLDGETLGKIGIIGPTRMNYLKLTKTLKIFSENISEIINNNY